MCPGETSTYCFGLRQVFIPRSGLMPRGRIEAGVGDLCRAWAAARELEPTGAMILALPTHRHAPALRSFSPARTPGPEPAQKISVDSGPGHNQTRGRAKGTGPTAFLGSGSPEERRPIWRAVGRLVSRFGKRALRALRPGQTSQTGLALASRGPPPRSEGGGGLESHGPKRQID